MPNKGLELTASSVCSAPASGSSSGLAFGVAIHGVTSASPRESAEFPTSVKEVVTRFVYGLHLLSLNSIAETDRMDL
jgi:hypothetical protein